MAKGRRRSRAGVTQVDCCSVRPGGSLRWSGGPGLGYGPRQLVSLLGSQGYTDIARPSGSRTYRLSNDRDGYRHGVDQYCEAITDVICGEVSNSLSAGVGEPDLEDESLPNPGLDRLDLGDVGIGQLGLRADIYRFALAIYRRWHQ